MYTRKQSSILLSIFKRKGAEGHSTKILDCVDNHQPGAIIKYLENDEKTLVAFYINEINWVLLSDFRLLINENGAIYEIKYDNISEVHPAMQEELKGGVKSMLDFTKIKIKEKNNNVHIITVEQGAPYAGIIQMLYFIVN